MVADGDNNRADILDEALTQFVNAYVQGEQPDVEEFVKQYPPHEAQIRRRVENLHEIDALFDSLLQVNGSDFVDTPAEHNLAGQKIRSFEIVEMIGRGGMGIVYLARDTKLKRSVAIKSMPAGLAGDSTARMRFRREAELLASMNHPNIAVIHEIIEQDEAAGYLILEYVPGETLAERIAGEPLKLEQALSIGRQIAEAVSAAHEKGIVHRDLKPGNIKITPEGRVKVLDFGLAKVSGTEDRSSETTASEPGRVMGTPAYMSPEQARGKATDQRTDIWSFGCVMYQMLTGRLPFEGETATDTLARIIERDPDWQALPKETPENVQALLRHCLEKDPDQRLGDITDAGIVITETPREPATAPLMTIKPGLRRITLMIGAVIVMVLAGLTLWLGSNQKETRIVVLPYEHLGSVKDEDYAAGITVEITSHLAKIRRLSVISPRSAMQYLQTGKKVGQIANELRVDYILEGTVQCERPSDPTSPVRITSRLIKTSDDTLVWSERHDSIRTGVFQVLSNVPKQVAQAMDVKLLPSDRQALAYKPTENNEAYDYYLRGDVYSSRPYQVESNLSNAIQLYEKAVGLDDQFALAYAKLSQAYSGMYWFEHDRSERRLAMAKKAVDKAFELAPELPETHWALGFYYYWGFRDCDLALRHFAIARKGRPNDSRLIAAMAYAQRWQGKFDQALINIKEAYELSPIDPVFATELGKTLRDMRKYEEAAHYCKRAIELGPDQPKAYEWMASIYLRQKGDTKEARDILEDALQHIKSIDDTGGIIYLLGTIDIYEGNYQEALDRLEVESEDVDTMDYNKALRCARIYRYFNEEDRARRYFESARKNIEKKIQEDSGSYWLYSHLGIAYAGLGRKEDAIQMGIRATESLPITENAWRGTFPIEFLANIYVMVGEHDAALDQIEFLLSVHGRLSIPILQLDPAWDPLRDHHRFKKLIAANK